MTGTAATPINSVKITTLLTFILDFNILVAFSFNSRSSCVQVVWGMNFERFSTLDATILISFTSTAHIISLQHEL